jgi:hypothetical protein
MSFVLRQHCHSVAYISDICHFDMANATIRRQFRAAELWRALVMVQQAATLCQVDVHHIAITGAWERYRLHGKPARIHAGGQQWVTTPAQDRLLVVQARRARFSTSTYLRNDLANAAGVRDSIKRYVEGCLKVICDREDLA